MLQLITLQHLDDIRRCLVKKLRLKTEFEPDFIQIQDLKYFDIYITFIDDADLYFDVWFDFDSSKLLRGSCVGNIQVVASCCLFVDEVVCVCDIEYIY